MKTVVCPKCQQSHIVINNNDYVICCGEVIYVLNNNDSLNEK